MKKIFITILSSLILVSCIGFNTFAQDQDTIENIEQLQDAITELASTDDVEIPEEYAEKVANIAINFAWAFSGGGKLLFGSCLSGGIVGILDIATDLLEQIIYFGPSQEELDRQELMDKLNSIDASIGDVNSKVDSLADQINESIKQIDAKLDNISIKLDKENISNVADIANYLINEMDNYDTVLNSQVQTWYLNQNINNYLTAGNFILKAPNGRKVLIEDSDEYRDDYDVIFVSPDLMSTTLNKYIEEQLKAKGNNGWNSDHKDDIAKEIFARIFNSDDFDKTNGSQFDTWIKKKYRSYVDWDSFGSKEEAISILAEAGYGTLCEIAATNIAKTTNGADTYVKGLVEKFNAYCNYLTEKNGEYTSPLASYANIYSSIYAFQGDLKRTIEIDEYDESGNKTGNKIKEDTNLLKLSMEKYIGELNQLGTFVGIMAKASGNYGEKSDMRKLVYIPWAAAEKKLQDDYSKYYHIKKVTVYGEEIESEVDNYCYITNSVIDYFAGTLYCDLVMKFYAWENGFGTDIKSYRDTYMNEDWSFSYDNSQMVDTTNLNLIFAHYAHTNGDVPFSDYLTNNTIEVDKDLPSTIVTRFVGGRDFTSDDKVKMFVKNCHNNPDKWEGKDYLKGDTTTVTSSSKYFKVRRKATADVFDLNNGIVTLGKRIGAVASFYEKYTFKDDLVVFWDAEYNNPKDLNELKALANKDYINGVYWRDRYDTSDDDEERYRSHVEYCRNYGTLLSYPLESKDAPVPINRVSFNNAASKNILDDEDNAFEKALKEAGISLEDYKDFIYDDTYRVYVDETNYNEIIDEDVYKEFMDFCNNKENIDSMTKDYYQYNDLVSKMIDNLGDELIIKNNADAIAKSLVKKDLDCIIVNSIPNKNKGKNVYDYTTGKLYVWKDNKYVEYDGDNTLLKTTGFEEGDILAKGPDDPEYFTNKFNKKLMKTGDYPTSNSKDIKLKYNIKLVLAYELYFDGEGQIKYRVYPTYDVTPMLEWNDNGEIKQKPVSIEVLKDNGISRVGVNIPVISKNNSTDNYASIYHYEDYNQTQTPIRKISSKIKTIGKYSYSNINIDSFGPYIINKTYYKNNEIDDSDHQKFIMPATGVN